MKQVLLTAPLVAALVFAVPEAWQQLNDPGPGYVPVINELLLLAFGFVAAIVSNAVVIVPLCLLLRLKTANLLAGMGLAFVVALLVTTVAYAFEIFAYQTSIFHPEYLYPLFIPLFVLTLLSFFFVARIARPHADNDNGENGEAENGRAEDSSNELEEPAQ